MEEKVCKGCGRSLPITKFERCRDAYTGETKWRLNTCNQCRNRRKLGKRLPKFTA